MDHAADVNRQIGGKRKADGADRLIGELASRQHGVVARRQLLALGVGPDAIDTRLRLDRLQPLYRAVYLVGHPAAKREARWMGAVLAGGERAVLRRRSAAALWEIRRGVGTGVEVAVPRQRRAQPGIRFHVTSLPADEVTTHDGIPVTTVPRTLFDLATVLDELQLERAVTEAEIRRLWSELSLHDLLERYPRRAGSRTVRAVLRKRQAGTLFLRSDLEEMFVRFADEAALPRPETNALVEGLEVDAVWRDQRLVIEVDGWETHRTRHAFERDREKSRVLQAAGWRCVPVTARQLRYARRDLARDVRSMLGLTTLAA